MRGVGSADLTPARLVAQLRDLGLVEADFAQDFVGVLADRRRAARHIEPEAVELHR